MCSTLDNVFYSGPHKDHMHLQLAVLYSFWCAVDPLRQQAYIDSMSILHNHLAWKLRKATGGTSPATCEISLALAPVEYQTCTEDHFRSFFYQCELASWWSQGSPQWRDSQDCIVPAFGGTYLGEKFGATFQWKRELWVQGLAKPP